MKRIFLLFAFTLSCDMFKGHPPPPSEGLNLKGEMLLSLKTQNGYDLYILRLPEDTLVRITDLAGDEIHPSFTTQGVLFSSNTGGDFSVYEINGGLRGLYSGEGEQFYPTLRPSGDLMAFITTFPDTLGDLAFYSLQSGDLFVPIRYGSEERFPRFVNDTLVVLVSSGGVWAYNLKTQMWLSLISPESGSVSFPTVSRRGKLAYVLNGNGVFVSDFPSSRSGDLLTVVNGGITGMAWDPEGIYLGISSGKTLLVVDTSGEIWKIREFQGDVMLGDWKM